MLRYGGVYHQIISFGPWPPHYGVIGPEFFPLVIAHPHTGIIFRRTGPDSTLYDHAK